MDCFKVGKDELYTTVYYLLPILRQLCQLNLLVMALFWPQPILFGPWEKEKEMRILLSTYQAPIFPGYVHVFVHVRHTRGWLSPLPGSSVHSTGWTAINVKKIFISFICFVLLSFLVSEQCQSPGNLFHKTVKCCHGINSVAMVLTMVSRPLPEETE